MFARYRYTLVPVLMLFAAAGAVALADALRARRPRAAWPSSRSSPRRRRCLVHWPLAGTADSALTHFSVGSALLEQGRAREALPELERAVAARPDFPQATLRLADALRETGDPARALALCDAVIARDPGLADAHVSRGLALGALGRNDDAIAAPTSARSGARRAPRRRAQRPRQPVRAEAATSERAIAHYRRALALRPNDANFEANLGAGLLQARRSATRRSCTSSARSRSRPGHSTARLNRATTLVCSVGSTRRALAYAEVIRLEPAGSPYAARARDDLEQLGSAP